MERMSPVVRTVVKIAFAPMFAFGAYIILHGHLTPGGGFQGGAIIGSLMALYLVAFGATAWKKKLLSGLESGGLLVFIGTGILGLVSGLMFYNFLADSDIPIFNEAVPTMLGYTHSNWAPLWTGGTISVMNLAVGIEVIAGLTLIVITMGLFAFEGKEGG
ncbi:MAG TPA: sodium:proton antiporter [Euryarchaeota archaeon]|nr:MAG: sodium:proton antiporter [Thermoplasmatales archaeon ex4484_6]RLF69140.1 MAG: sodium:proton antiporter [Thermoplasmata archaeon]HHD15857.1 sodium:proton antiporter [Euryarchaeota archaeon]